MKITEINTHILDPVVINNGFIVDDGKYAVIPIAGSDTKMMVVYDNCKKMKVCRNRQSAENFIKKERKRKNKS
tara:strand:+ start:32 stop:250 length:219 start_codon:yes stop_codon:yes gene_type:complete